jgi:hypothetical protein
MSSNFANLRYTGSLYLQKNTFTSFFKTEGRRCMISRIFRRATYCTSGPDDNVVTGKELFSCASDIVDIAFT